MKKLSILIATLAAANLCGGEPVHEISVGPMLTAAHQKLDIRSYTGYGPGFNAAYRYQPYRGVFVHAAYNQIFHDAKFCKKYNGLEVADVQGQIGFVFPIEYVSVTPYAGYGYVNMHYFFKQTLEVFSYPTLLFRTYYVPVGVRVHHKFEQPYEIEANLFWLFDTCASFKVDGIPDSRWDLKNKYGYGAELSLTYNASAHFALKLIPAWRFQKIGRSVDKSLEVGSFTYNAFSLSLMLAYRF